MSPRSTTRPLYFWCFASNSAFLKWHMSISDANELLHPSSLLPLVFFGLLTGSPDRLSRRTPGRTPFHPRAVSSRTSSTDPSASHNTFSVPTTTEGNARIRGRSTFPALTLVWLYIEQCLRAEEYDRHGGPVDSDPGAVFEDDPHPRSDGGRPLETLGSRRSCPGWAAAHFTWMLTDFTSLACYLDALPG